MYVAYMIGTSYMHVWWKDFAYIYAAYNFRFLKFKNKEAFFILHIFSIDAPISVNNHFSESAIAANQ